MRRGGQSLPYEFFAPSRLFGRTSLPAALAPYCRAESRLSLTSTPPTPGAGNGLRAVVIGAGVVGAASAYYLAEAGWDVTVIDRGTFGGGCSHGNCGYVCPSHVLPLAEEGALGRALGAMFSKSSPFY